MLNFRLNNISTMLAQFLLITVLVFQVCWASPIGLEPRITDGSDAIPGEFPYQVSVEWGFPPLLNFEHICGGSILNERYILTAGHCISEIGTFRILAGKHKMNEIESTQQAIEVEKTIVHKDYKGGIAEHDIALLKLKTPLSLNEKVSPVSIPIQDEVRTGNAVLTGWGSTSKDFDPEVPDVLQKAVMPLLDNPTCYQKFQKSDKPNETPELFETQICTAAVEETSACTGDSGGPLVQFEDGVPIQIGIVSWGVYPCGVSRLPSVYTRVASYADWIYDTVEL